METLAEIFSHGFMVRAIVVGLLVSLCAALLGVNLVLKRYAMIGTGLSHVGFAAMVIAGAFEFIPDNNIVNDLTISLVVVVMAAFFLLRLNDNSKINGDSAVALVSTSGLAIGVIVMGLTTGITLHICNILFGSILAMTIFDVYLSVALSVVVLVLFVVFYKQLFAVTYDEDFARATGTKVEVYKTLLALLTAVTVVLGMRMMGALLIASLTLFPAISAMRICRRFFSVVVTAAVISLCCFFVGMVLSFELNLPPGASIVGINLIVYMTLSGVSLIKRGGKRA